MSSRLSYICFLICCRKSSDLKSLKSSGSTILNLPRISLSLSHHLRGRDFMRIKEAGTVPEQWTKLPAALQLRRTKMQLVVEDARRPGFAKCCYLHSQSLWLPDSNIMALRDGLSDGGTESLGWCSRGPRGRRGGCIAMSETKRPK